MTIFDLIIFGGLGFLAGVVSQRINLKPKDDQMSDWLKRKKNEYKKYPRR